MSLLKRLKNIWHISAIDPEKYSIGFKFNDWVKPQDAPEQPIKNSEIRPQATIIKLRPKDEITEILKDE